MPRYSIDLTDEEAQEVKTIAKEEDRTIASALRCLVRRQLQVGKLLENGAIRLKSAPICVESAENPQSPSPSPVRAGTDSGKEEEEEKKKRRKKKNGLAPLSVSEEVIGYLNELTGGEMRASATGHRKIIQERLTAGATVADLKTVIRKKCAEWLGKPMQTNLKPSCLFRASNFDGYLDQLEAVEGQQSMFKSQKQSDHQDYTPEPGRTDGNDF